MFNDNLEIYISPYFRYFTIILLEYNSYNIIFKPRYNISLIYDLGNDWFIFTPKLFKYID